MDEDSPFKDNSYSEDEDDNFNEISDRNISENLSYE